MNLASEALIHPLVAEASRSVFERLDDYQRLGVISGLAIIGTVTAFLFLFIVSFARITRWYMNRQPRATRMPGDPFQHVIDGKPRVSRHELLNWRKR